jgi:hypothetical protein
MDLKYKKSLSLILIWGSILIEILILSLIKSYIPDFDSIIAVLIHIIFTLVVLISCRNKIKIVFIGAFLARLFFLFWDIYAKSIFTLPNSGADSEKFFNQAVNLSKNLSALINNDSNIYAKIMGFLFYWIGPQRILGQYINVLLGLSIIIIIYKILIILEIRTKIINLIVFLAAFFPNSIIMSSIFLREMFVTFFVASSLYYFIKWYKSGRYIEMLLSIFMLGASSIFHSGVIGIIIGYFFIFLFYDKNNKHFRFRIKTIFTCILIIAIVSTGFVMAGDIILKKFQKVDEISDVYRTANSRLGESIYLINLKIKSTTELIMMGICLTQVPPIYSNWFKLCFSSINKIFICCWSNKYRIFQ